MVKLTSELGLVFNNNFYDQKIANKSRKNKNFLKLHFVAQLKVNAEVLTIKLRQGEFFCCEYRLLKSTETE